MATNYKMTIVYNAASLGVATNIFWFQHVGGSPDPDDTVLSLAKDWAEDIYGDLTQFMALAFKLKEGVIDEVDTQGVKVRTVGSIDPDISGISSGDPLTLPAAGSTFARTSVPRVMGRKRWPGFHEGTTAGALFINNLVSGLATATLEWLAGPATIIFSEYVAGVISKRIGDFVPFADSGVATNVPGTQVTRKPLRGI